MLDDPATGTTIVVPRQAEAPTGQIGADGGVLNRHRSLIIDTSTIRTMIRTSRPHDRGFTPEEFIVTVPPPNYRCRLLRRLRLVRLFPVEL